MRSNYYILLSKLRCSPPKLHLTTSLDTLCHYTYEEALQLDLKNGNTKWQDATKLEMEQLQDYECFKDYGIYGMDLPPEGYKKIRVHLIFDVKHDAHHKARCVADGHLTDVPIDSVYSGVVSLHSLCIITFLSEHNDLEMWATDIGNAYRKAFTSEKLYIHSWS